MRLGGCPDGQCAGKWKMGPRLGPLPSPRAVRHGNLPGPWARKVARSTVPGEGEGAQSCSRFPLGACFVPRGIVCAGNVIIAETAMNKMSSRSHTVFQVGSARRMCAGTFVIGVAPVARRASRTYSEAPRQLLEPRTLRQQHR